MGSKEPVFNVCGVSGSGAPGVGYYETEKDTLSYKPDHEGQFYGWYIMYGYRGTSKLFDMI